MNITILQAIKFMIGIEKKIEMHNIWKKKSKDRVYMGFNGGGILVCYALKLKWRCQLGMPRCCNVNEQP